MKSLRSLRPALAVLLLGAVSLPAQTHTVLHTFTSATDGASPTSHLVQGVDGRLYGLTSRGGANANGTVYRTDADGTGFTRLFFFPAGGTAPQAPNGYNGAWLQGRDGAFYGVTTLGGTVSGGQGTLFKINADGTGFTVLRTFLGLASRDGGLPRGGLLQAPDGTLYGTTVNGSATGTAAENNAGTLYRIAPDGTGYQVIFSFNSVGGQFANGREPTSLLLGRDGRLYGTTLRGGAFGSVAFSPGAIFTLRTDGTGFQLVRSFTGTGAPGGDGMEPDSPLVQDGDGVLYGTTLFGGDTNRGTIYRINPDGSGYRILHSFAEVAPSGGNNPGNAFFLGADGALYGTTAGVTAAGRGTVYRINRDGSGYRTLASFPVVSTGTVFYGLMQAANGAFFGTYPGTGSELGAIYRLDTPAGPAIPGRLVNLSVRTSAGTGAQTLIAGFVVGGSGAKQVLVRAIGPTLAAFNVTGVLADPQLSLFAGNTAIVTNASWGGTTALANAFTQVGAFSLAANARDSALLAPLAADSYSAQVTSVAGGTGVVLVEAYDADGPASGSRFVNLSARTFAGTGAQTLIAGFVLSGSSPRTLLIRGIGPGLDPFGVTGTLATPRLELRTVVNNVDTLVASNAGWGNSPALAAAFAQVGAFPLPAGSADAALLVTLNPGAYTAQVAGTGGATGVALVEIYEMP